MKVNRNLAIALVFSALIVPASLYSAIGRSRLLAQKRTPHTWSPAIKAIVQKRCVSCHNDQRHPEATNLSSYEKMMESGEHGKMVVFGHPEMSKLLLYVDGEKQPRMPMRSAPLSNKDIATIRNWIRTGR